MSGIFGGIHKLFNITGGLIIFALVGKCAWRINLETEIFRMLFGSIEFGLILGFIAKIINNDKEGTIVVAIALTILFAAFIEFLKLNISETD